MFFLKIGEKMWRYITEPIQRSTAEMCPKIEAEKKVVQTSQVDVAYMSIFKRPVSYIIIIIIIAVN